MCQASAWHSAAPPPILPQATAEKAPRDLSPRPHLQRPTPPSLQPLRQQAFPLTSWTCSPLRTFAALLLGTCFPLTSHLLRVLHSDVTLSVRSALTTRVRSHPPSLPHWPGPPYLALLCCFPSTSPLPVILHYLLCVFLFCLSTLGCNLC